MRKYPSMIFIITSICAFLISSCSKDADLLSEYVIKDNQNASLVNLLVNDTFSTTSNSTIILDVLANDNIINIENIKIIATTNPKFGEIEILENNTLKFIVPEVIPAEESVEPTVVNTTTIPTENTVEGAVTETIVYTTETTNTDNTVQTDSATIILEITIDSFQNYILDDLKTVPEFQIEFDKQWTIEESWYISRSTSGDSSDLYCLGEAVDGLISIFRATGDTAYLDDAISLVNNAINQAVVSSTLPNSSWNDGYLTWEDKPGSSCSVSANNGNEIPLAESRFAQNVGYLLWTLYERPSLRTNGYETEFASIRDFMDVNFWNKWISRDSNWPYKSSVDGSSGWAGFSLFMEIITGDAKYTANVNNFDTTTVNGAGNLRDHIEPNSGDASAYQWGLLWDNEIYAPIGTDVSDHPHAGRAVKYMVNSKDLGRYWTSEDMTALINTVEVFWPTDSIITYIMDGTSNSTSSGNNDKSGLPEGWVMLGRYDGNLQHRFETKDISYEEANNTSAQFYGVLALNRAILNNSISNP
tara:strand:+ start:16923 stop:18512 length:1590 start_codon:yes stop_codon:yes gene_type:complete